MRAFQDLRTAKSFEPLFDTSNINSRYIYEAFGTHMIEDDDDLDNFSKEHSTFCTHQRRGASRGLDPFSSNYSAFKLSKDQMNVQERYSSLEAHPGLDSKSKKPSGFNINKNEVFSDGQIRQDDSISDDE